MSSLDHKNVISLHKVMKNDENDELYMGKLIFLLINIYSSHSPRLCLKGITSTLGSIE